MIFQLCPLCQKKNFSILHKQNFSLSQINEKVFSARRLPDKLHYQIVRCRHCSLIYSNPILPYEKIETLYKKSFTDYDEQISNLKETYGFYLKKLSHYQLWFTHRSFSEGESKKHGIKKYLTFLDIGCGNGFMLEEALKQGYRSVYGVEPGKKSVDKAPLEIKKNIIVDIFKPGLFKNNFFDVITCFQTLDHIPDPNSFLLTCYQALKKNGLVLFLNHDVGAFTNRLMGKRSPVIDVEHTCLFDKKTIVKMFKKHRFQIIEVGSAFNIHYLSYWIHLIPLPNVLKLKINQFLKIIKLDKLIIKIYPGNLYIIARK